MSEGSEKPKDTYLYLVCYTFFKDRIDEFGDIRGFGYDFVTSDSPLETGEMAESVQRQLAEKVSQTIIVTSICSLQPRPSRTGEYVYLLAFAGTQKSDGKLAIGSMFLGREFPFTTRGEIFELIHSYGKDKGLNIVPTSLQLLSA